MLYVTPYCDSVEVGRIFQCLNMTPCVGTSKPEIRCVLPLNYQGRYEPGEGIEPPFLACYLNTSRGRRVITSDSDFRVISPLIIFKHTNGMGNWISLANRTNFGSVLEYDLSNDTRN